MKHLGDITEIDWFSVEPVDVVTGGSPCQDLSVAGKRAGLAGERSGLYMEQIKCVKELREADVHRGRTGQFIRPRYMVWENVPGAFSSGNPKGSDFAAVIEEIIKIAEPDAVVCVVPPSGGWTKSGCYYDSDGRWSIAWRVHDAQFWGVPQRRKRIALVADFGGLSAPEILFERKGLRGYFAEGRTPWQGTSSDAERGAGADDSEGTVVYESHPMDSRIKELDNGVSPTVSVKWHKGAADTPLVVKPMGINGAVSATLDASYYKGCGMRQGVEHEVVAIPIHDQATRFSAKRGDKSDGKGDGLGVGSPGDPMNTLTSGDRHAVCYSETYQKTTGPLMANSHPGSYSGQDAYTDMFVVGKEEQPIAIDRAFFNQGQNALYDPQLYADGTNPTLVARGPNAVAVRYIVRRLTPTEGERLQGFPDGWTDIGDWVDSKGKMRKAADAPRYKALGNSIALPFWCWLAKRISAQYERDLTMGSLFDGIGGFPYAFEKCGGKALWASEIEEFPIAVTKIRFPEDNANG